MRKASRRQWIKFGIILTLYLLFLIWVRSWLGLILVPVIFDIYISKKIPWTFWKKSKNKNVRSIMSWVDAILFALIAVYFVNIFLFQNYQIPSSSLEKTLLVGDFLYVSKVSYGPRVPNTPLSMPLAQHTLPVLNTKSYIEFPQWDYKRVKGFGHPKHNDIVVFNFPAGDTVALNLQQLDFYNLAYSIGKNMYPAKINLDSISPAQQEALFDLYYDAGRNQILSNPNNYGKVIHRPVDRRENYVKRCIALPGDTLQIINRDIYLNGVKQQQPEGVQFFYIVTGTGKIIPQEFFRELGLSLEDTQDYRPGSTQFVLPLTDKAKETLLTRKDLVTAAVPLSRDDTKGTTYPLNLHTNWTIDNYGPIWMPAKGSTIQLTPENVAIYQRCIEAYENNTFQKNDDGYYINGLKAESYTFKMDYYWMMGDNRHNSLDSRSWGFVPEDHVVGKPILVWLSLDKDRGWFNGKIRWNRIFKKVH